MGISFLSPVFLMGAAVAAAPILLHLFRRRPLLAIPFSAIRFLDREPVNERRRRRLREILLLALRVSAVVVLVTAFARPYLTGTAAAVGDRTTMVALDLSYSMSAPGQFERAQALAKRAISSADQNALVGVVFFDDHATLAVKPTADRAAAMAAIDRARPGFGGTRYQVALARAAEAIGAAAGQIVVVTDLQQSGWDASEAARVPRPVVVDVLDAGAPASNLAVIDFRAEPDGLVAAIRNSGPLASSGRARLTVNDRVVGSVPFAAPPAGVTDVQFPSAGGTHAASSVSIDDRIGYAADNTRYLVLDPPDSPLLLALTTTGDMANEAFYLERALTVDRSKFQLESVGAERASTWSADEFSRYEMTLVLGTRGLDRKGREALAAYVRGGGKLIVVLGGEVEPDVVEALLAPAWPVRLTAAAAAQGSRVSLSAADVRHPVFRTFGTALGALSGATFQRTVTFDASSGAAVLARFSNGAPGLVEGEVGQGRVLLFLSDMNNRWNDMPLQPTFVPFVHEMIRYLAMAADRPQEYLVGEVPAGMSAVPGIQITPAAAPSGSGAATTSRRVAVNVDPKESDPARFTAAEFQAAVARINDVAAERERVQAQDQEEQQHLWRYGLALVAAAFMTEGLVARRLAAA